MAKLEDLFKTLLKNGLKISPKSVSFLRKNCNVWDTFIIIKDRKDCVKPFKK